MYSTVAQTPPAVPTAEASLCKKSERQDVRKIDMYINPGVQEIGGATIKERGVSGLELFFPGPFNVFALFSRSVLVVT